MHILVTGGAGYIGSHVVKQLLQETEHQVTVIDNLSNTYIGEKTVDALKSFDQNGSLTFIEEDIKNFDAIESVFKREKFDALIHFAASLVVSESVTNPLKYYMNNTVNTTNLIRLCNDYSVNKVIFSSTAAVYGEPEKVPIDETTATNPINPYGMSKLMSEFVIKDTAKANSDFKYVILRYFNVAGADIDNNIGENHEPETHLIPLIVETALGKREKIMQFGDDYETEDGSCIRDYVHVEDLASAHIAALVYLEKEATSNIFNCGYGHGFSVKEVIETVKKVSGVDFKVEIAPRREGDPAILISDNTKIKEVMQWRPKYDDLDLICQTALAWERKI